MCLSLFKNITSVDIKLNLKNIKHYLIWVYEFLKFNAILIIIFSRDIIALTEKLKQLN